jgi:hypothetical protein
MSLTTSRLTIYLLLFLSFLVSPNATRAQQFSYPPTIPLAVRSPYLNCLLQYNQTFTTTFGHAWPTTSNLSQVCHPNISYGHEILNFLHQTLGWSVLVRVDDQTYSFLGDVDPSLINGTVNSTHILVGPSSSILSGRAGPMQVNLTFLNPIEVRSRPFLNFNVYIRIMLSLKIGSSNPSHSRICPLPQSQRTARVIMSRCTQMSVEVLAIILQSASFLLSFVTEWTSGDRTQKLLWNTTFDSFAIYHNVTLQTPATYTEILDQPEWGTLYFATPSVSFMALYFIFSSHGL